VSAGSKGTSDLFVLFDWTSEDGVDSQSVAEILVGQLVVLANVLKASVKCESLFPAHAETHALAVDIFNALRDDGSQYTLPQDSEYAGVNADIAAQMIFGEKVAANKAKAYARGQAERVTMINNRLASQG
jgi:hypothetical protein